MATSPNFNWPEPDNTDLVKNGALAIRTAVDAIDTSLAELKGGTTGQVLSKTSNTDMDFTWTSATDQYPWTAYTPTLTNITLGNGTVIGRYQLVGKTVNLFFSLTLGSTTSFTAGIAVSLPVAPLYTNEYKGLASLNDNGVADYPAFFYAGQSPAVLYITAANTAGTYITTTPVNATTPFTWTTNDRFTLSLTYEAA
jgi:hypothetical protein